MKLRAIGTGFAYCRHPLIPPSFLIQTEDSNILIGCPYQIAAKLESINLSCDKIDMILLLGIKGHQIGGLEEFARLLEKDGESKGATLLVAPLSLIEALKKRLLGVMPKPLEAYFSVRDTNKVRIKEDEYTTDTLLFLPIRAPDYSKNFGLVFDEAKILISGEASEPHEYLWDESLKLILQDAIHGSDFVEKLSVTLPVYVQKKVWLYGYPNNYEEIADPMPMLFLPQGSCVYDSKRKEKYFEKERFIREMSKRQLGNKPV